MNPKDYYSSTKLISDPGLCFVLMPFANMFDEVWDVIRNTLSNPPFNLLCRRADDISRPGHILDDVLENIGRARLLIADLTGQNPNVFYELGVAHTVKHSSQVILISSEEVSIPFDLRNLRCIIYQNDMVKLAKLLSGTIKDLGIKQYDLTLKEGDCAKVGARLSGDDRCLYEVEISAKFIGDDGVKFWLRVIRFAADAEPLEVCSEGHYLGFMQTSMLIPCIPWSLCYHKESDSTVRFIVGRPPGWEPSFV